MGWKFNNPGGCVSCSCGPCDGTICVSMASTPVDLCGNAITGTFSEPLYRPDGSLTAASVVIPGTSPVCSAAVSGTWHRAMARTPGYSSRPSGQGDALAVACAETTSIVLETIYCGPCACCYAELSPTLELTYTPGVGDTTPGGSYASASFAYYCSAPAYMDPSAFSGANYYSTALWSRGGSTYYYRLSCNGSIWTLGVGERGNNPSYPGTPGAPQYLWFPPGGVYRWTVAISGIPNSCSPFALTSGAAVTVGSVPGTFVVA